MLEFHITPLCRDLLPRISEAMQVHVEKKTTTHPMLMSLMSLYEPFSTALSKLVDYLKGGASTFPLQLRTALELSCIPFSKLHMRNIIGDNHITRELWNDICLLGKTLRILCIFLAALEHLPQLRSFSVICLDTPGIPANSTIEPQSLKKTLRKCGLSPDVTTLHTLVNKYLSMECCQTLHAKLQRQEPMVHAEVQVIVHLPKKDSDGVFPYR
jgi:hypothetical protein